MKDALDRLDSIHKRKEARLTQALALMERQMNSQYDELARVYGSPKDAIPAPVLKLIDDVHKLVVNLGGKDAEIQGQLKLGKEKK